MRAISTTVATVLLLAIIAGCASVQTTSTPTPQAPKKVAIGIGELLKSFDPPTDWAHTATWIHSNISDCLVWRHRDTAEFVPWLAERWEVVSDKAWKFHLRKGVTFHNGEPFNAEAAKFTIDRILADNKMLVYGQWQFVANVEVIDELTIQVNTKLPEPAMLSKMAGTGCQVVPPKYMKEVGPEVYARKPIGTGAFKFVQEIKDDRVILAANENYFKGKPDIDELVFLAIPEASTRVNQLLTGGTDFTDNVPPQDWDRINNNATTQIVSGLGNRIAQANIRMGDKEGKTYLLTNKNLRAAVEHAIDKNKLVSLIGGLGVPTRTHILPPIFSWHEGLYGPINGNIYDPNKARELLKGAGYAGQELELVTSTGAWLMSKEVGESIVAMLREVGFNAKLTVLDVTTYREKIYNPTAQELVAFQHINMDATRNSFFDPWITGLGYSRPRSVRFGIQDDEIDALVKSAAVNMNVESRKADYRKLQEIIAREHYALFLYHIKESYGVNKRLSWPIPPDGFLWMGNAKVLK